MSDDRRHLDLLTYIKHAIDMRRLIRANEYDSRIRKDKEVHHFCDANVIIELGTMINLAHATNLFAITPAERLNKFFDFQLDEELGPEATAIVVGAFETAAFIASGRLRSQATPRLHLTEEHRDEFFLYLAHLRKEVQQAKRTIDETYEENAETIALTRSKDPIKIIRELFTKVKDRELLGLLSNAGVLDRLSKLARSGRLMTENVAQGEALRPDDELAHYFTEKIAAYSPKNENSAKRDGASLAKLIALQEKWRAAGSAQRCVLITRDSAIHSVYRAYYFATPLGQSDDADDWYLLREPAQYAPVLNMRDLRGPKRMAPTTSFANKQVFQVFQNLGDSALGVLSAQRVLVRDEAAPTSTEPNRPMAEQYREHGAFLDNVRSYASLLPPRSTMEARKAADDLRDLWRDATLASVAVKADAADAGDALAGLTSWIKEPRNLKDLLATVEEVTTRAAHDNAAFALQTVRESHGKPNAELGKRALVVLIRKEKPFDPNDEFEGTFEDYRRATIECLDYDAWMSALFFATRCRHIGRRESVSAQRELDAHYLFSISCRLALSRMSDLDEALAACRKSLPLARAETSPGYSLRARSELYAVQITQWLYMRTAEESWAAPIRPAHLERTKFFRDHGPPNPANDLQEIRRIRAALERDAVLIQHQQATFWREAVERQVQLNLFLARWLCCIAEHGASKCHEDVEEALAELNDYLFNGANDPPIFINALRNLAHHVVMPTPETLAIFNADLERLRRAPDGALPAISTDRLMVEYLFRAVDAAT